MPNWSSVAVPVWSVLGECVGGVCVECVLVQVPLLFISLAAAPNAAYLIVTFLDKSGVYSVLSNSHSDLSFTVSYLDPISIMGLYILFF